MGILVCGVDNIKSCKPSILRDIPLVRGDCIDIPLVRGNCETCVGIPLSVVVIVGVLVMCLDPLVRGGCDCFGFVPIPQL